jgi:hypothetical protein
MIVVKVLQSRRVQQPGQDRFFYSPGVTEPDATGPSPGGRSPTLGPQKFPRTPSR